MKLIDADRLKEMIRRKKLRKDDSYNDGYDDALHDVLVAVDSNALSPWVREWNEPQIETILELKQIVNIIHTMDLEVRVNGEDRRYEADWLKPLLRSLQLPSNESERQHSAPGTRRG